MDIVLREFFRNVDTASTDATTDILFGRYAQQFQNLPGSATAAASTTVTEGVSGNAFAQAIGRFDELYNPANGNRVYVTAKASDASITVSSSVTWTAANLQLRKWQGGQGPDDGWIGVAGLTNKTVHLEVKTLGSTSIAFHVQTRMNGQNSSRIISPAAITAASVSTTDGSSTILDIPITEGAEALRVGALINTDGTDVFSASFYGERVN